MDDENLRPGSSGLFQEVDSDTPSVVGFDPSIAFGKLRSKRLGGKVHFKEEPTINCSFLLSGESEPTDPPYPDQIQEDKLYSPYDIFTAASLGDYATLKQLLQQGCPVNSVNSQGWSPLMYAAYLDHISVCYLLLEHGAAINCANPSGQTSLMFAAACGNLSILLTSKGGEVDQQDGSGDTALSVAVACSQNEIAEFLLESGANPNIKNKSGMTPTLVACSTGHELTLLTVLEYGGDINVKNDKGEAGKTLAADNPKAMAILQNPPEVKQGKNSSTEQIEINSLATLFKVLNINPKYCKIFKQRSIDLEEFLELSEHQLEEIGVKALIPKRKMVYVINKYSAEKNFEFLQQCDFNEDTNLTQKQNQHTCDLIIEELNRVQAELSLTKQEVRRMRKLSWEYRDSLKLLKWTTNQTHNIALILLEEIKAQKSGYSCSFEMSVRFIETNLRQLQTTFLNFPLE